MVTADGNSRVTAYDRTVKADKDGKAWVRVFGTSSNASAYVGSYSVTATCGDDSLKGSFKVTAGSNAGGGDGGGDNARGAGGQRRRREAETTCPARVSNSTASPQAHSSCSSAVPR
ncbi:hypothetical protein IOD13_14505 [Brevibacterium casei]|nr:hypothetical protein [Brevibacterium casei]